MSLAKNQPKAEKHTHKLRRHKFKTGNTVYFCMLPDCNFKIAQPFALGKRSICHRCGEPFVMNEYSVRLAKPHCEDCHQTKAEITNETAIQMANDLPSVLNAIPDTIDDLKSRLRFTTSKIEDDEDEDL